MKKNTKTIKKIQKGENTQRKIVVKCVVKLIFFFGSEQNLVWY